MGNKKTFRKLWIFTLLFVWFGVSYTFAEWLGFRIDMPDDSTLINLIQWGSNAIIPIKFSDHGNDFWWFMYISSLEQGEYSVSVWSDTYNCDRQVIWWYYNAERGERLWPLWRSSRGDRARWEDQISDFKWWLYTSCMKGSIEGTSYDDALAECGEEDDSCKQEVLDKYTIDGGYYWYIDVEFEGIHFVMWAWMEYNTGWIWIEPKVNSKLAPTFMNVMDIPVWFIYDKDWWIGFAWCDWDVNAIKTIINKISDGTTTLASLFEKEWKILKPKASELGEDLVTCENPGSAWGSLLWLVVEWIVWLNKDNLWEYQNDEDRKMQYFYGVNVNNATLINYTRQKAESICRWKRWNGTSISDKIACVDLSQSGAPLVLDARNYSSFSGKTLVVKNGNVVIRPINSTWELNWIGHYDIFVDKWNLIIQEDSAMKFVFNVAWFVNTAMWVDEFNSNVASAFGDTSKEPAQRVYTWREVAAGALLKWNFIVNWHIIGSWSTDNLKNKYFLYGKFTSKDWYDELRNVFSWKCGSTLKWTDGNWCPGSCTNIDYCPTWSDSVQHGYQKAPLVVIDQSYDSPLYW